MLKVIMVEVNHIYGLIQLEHVTGRLRGDGFWVYIRGILCWRNVPVSSQPSALHTHTQVCRHRGACLECDQFVSDTACLISA